MNTLKEIKKNAGLLDLNESTSSDKLFKLIYNSTKEEVVGRVKKLSDKDLLNLRERKPRTDNSAQGVQMRAIEDEIKRRKL